MGSNPIIRQNLAVSSIGRAFLLHRKGYRFKSDTAKKFNLLSKKSPIKFLADRKINSFVLKEKTSFYLEM